MQIQTVLQSYLTRKLGHIPSGSLRLTLPSGIALALNGEQPGVEASIHFHNWMGAWRLVTGGSMGLAEGYLKGDWTTDSIEDVLMFFAANDETFGAQAGQAWPLRVWNGVKHWRNENSKDQSAKNIHYHYDLGNDFYSRWLDPTMTYSSGMYASPSEPLETAQARKFRNLATLGQVNESDKVLEIGCGWGGLLEFLGTEVKCQAKGITISQEQFAFCKERIQKLGLGERIDVELRDYRDVDQRFDKILSVEMFEAVGRKYWDTFFERCRALLSAAGRVSMQVITIDEKYEDQYRRNVDFIQKYVFPGGELPTAQNLEANGARAGLKLTDDVDFGLSYAKTCEEWLGNFRAAWPGIANKGKFDDYFHRLWSYYLAYCRAGFATRMISVRQVAYQPV
ncbi:MAG TPA: SAM-dependent methyltransferase [Alphaproteobacteria bacterium]|nr:SAM-dependent methyltransferase [Alphaproteobacteria bacterium]HAJ46959.1 SAM-dependent methyltransferase [Alphaproteobacteria bacterium]